MTPPIALALVLVPPALALGCVTPPVQSTPDMPRKVFDFAPQRVAAPPMRPPAATASPKHHLRFALAAARPQIAACSEQRDHRSGTIEVRVVFVIDGARSEVESAEVDALGDPTLSACVRDAVLAIAAPAIDVPAPEVWTISAPLEVDAHYTAAR